MSKRPSPVRLSTQARAYVRPRYANFRGTGHSSKEAAALAHRGLPKHLSDYSISERALSKWLSRSTEEKEKEHGNCLLTKAQEIALVALIVTLAAAGMPMIPAMVIEIVRATHVKDIKWSGWTWWPTFKARHRGSFTPRIAKQLKKQRADPRMVDRAEAFCDAYEQVRAANSKQGFAWVNADESPLNALNPLLNRKVLSRRGDKKVDFRCPDVGNHVTIVPFIDAAGSVIMVAYVIKTKAVVNKTTREIEGYKFSTVLPYTRPKDDDTGYLRYFFFTKSGYTDTTCWKAIIKKFAKVYWHNVSLKPNPVLIVDNHGPHLNADVIRDSQDLGVKTMFLPKNSTHITQPADNGAFAALNKSLARLVRRQLMGRKASGKPSGSSLVDIIMSVAHEGEKEAFTPSVIKGAWRRTGLFPYNRDLFVQRVKDAVAIDSPSVGSSTAIEQEARKLFAAWITGQDEVVDVDKVSGRLKVDELGQGFTDNQVKDLALRKKREKREKAAQQEAERQAKKLQRQKERVKATAEREAQADALRRSKARKRAEDKVAQRAALIEAFQSTCAVCARPADDSGEDKYWCMCPRCTATFCNDCGSKALTKHKRRCRQTGGNPPSDIAMKRIVNRTFTRL